MEKFIVSARKYRPQTFDTVVGQQHITTTLKNAIRNEQLAHAFLFCGPRGVGKTTCARILAKTINCEKITKDGEACNECNSCISFNEGTSMNIHELDAASNNSVDDIRSLVEQVRFAPQAGKYKVYIIDEVHMLSSSAFNAFLKTLEEPPPYAIFILATTEKHKILPTILSRCQIFDFKRITGNDTVEHLQEICEKESIKAEKAALQVIAQKSEGCMRDALSIMDKIVSFTNGELSYQNTLEHLNVLDADYFFKLLEAMQQQDLSSALLIYDDINRKGFEGDHVLNGFSEFLRNLLVCKDSKVLNLLEVVESFKPRFAAAAKTVDAGYLVSALNILNESEINFRSARNKRLHVELALIKLCYLKQALSLSVSEEGFNKKKAFDNVKPVAFRRIAMQSVPLPGTGAKPGKPTRAKLTIESEIVEKEPIQAPVTSPKIEKTSIAQPPTGDTLKVGRLASIRQQFETKSADNGKEIIPLEHELLRKHWDMFASKLKEARNPAFQSFDNAVLRIIDAGNFEVVTNNNLEQRFIEQEKRVTSEYLQQVFHNRALCFAVIVTDTPRDYVAPEKTMSKRDQYIQMVEQYPIIKDLKDKLRLELDY
jgi:DNA polymerase III subunit gamma/tau